MSLGQVFLNFLLIPICCLVVKPAFGSTLENKIFDDHRMTPVDLMYEAYQKSRVLLIGTSNHTNYEHYNKVMELLEIVKDDPNLKYIVMERAHGVSGFYEILSNRDFEFAVKEFTFTPDRAMTDNLCLNPEWSYTIKEIMPKLQEINRSRSVKHPILVRALEGMPSDLSPGPITKVNDGSCSGEIFKKFPELELIGLSRERELKTKSNFEKFIWNDLGPNGKVIYISHYMHLIYGFHGCRPSRDEKGSWSANLEPLTWVTPFLDSHPEARKEFKLILMDEKDKYYNPNGGLKLVERQAKRYPDSDFAFLTNPFKGINLEVGTDLFLHDSTINRNHFKHSSNKTLSEIFYGVIWNSRASSHTSLKSAHSYLPTYCKP